MPVRIQSTIAVYQASPPILWLAASRTRRSTTSGSLACVFQLTCGLLSAGMNPDRRAWTAFPSHGPGCAAILSSLTVLTSSESAALEDGKATGSRSSMSQRRAERWDDGPQRLQGPDRRYRRLHRRDAARRLAVAIRLPK